MILHIVRREQWVAAKSAGSYEPPSLEREGFIHFSLLEQVRDAGFVLPAELDA
ncbi:MAG: DUF952 domain-containing protein [Gaiellaceae bacterium]